MLMSNSRIAAVDVGNDSLKGDFWKIRKRTKHTECHCKRY